MVVEVGLFSAPATACPIVLSALARLGCTSKVPAALSAISAAMAGDGTTMNRAPCKVALRCIVTSVLSPA